MFTSGVMRIKEVGVKPRTRFYWYSVWVFFSWTDGRRQGNSDISVSFNLIESTSCTI